MKFQSTTNLLGVVAWLMGDFQTQQCSHMCRCTISQYNYLCCLTPSSFSLFLFPSSFFFFGKSFLLDVCIFLCVGSYLTTDFICLIVICIFCSLISSWVDFSMLYFYRKLPILFKFSNLLPQSSSWYCLMIYDFIILSLWFYNQTIV